MLYTFICLLYLYVLPLSFIANVNSHSCSLYVVVRPSVCHLPVTFVHATQAIEIFRNVCTPFGTLYSPARARPPLKLTFEEYSSSKGRHAKIHVGHSLTSCSEGSPEDHEKQSGDNDDLVHLRQVRRVLQGTAAPNRADTCTLSCTV